MVVLAASVRQQLLMFRRNPEQLMALVNAPLLTLAFLAIMRHAERPDLEAYAILGPAVITVWSMALLVSGELIDGERANGTLDAMIAAPAPIGLTVLGRGATVTAVSMLSLLESVLVARVAFGVGIGVEHPLLFAATLLAMALAMAGTAVVMAAVFVLHRSARIFQNSLSYPFYLLGGAVIPPEFLPHWLQPVTKVIFLSWATDLLRDCLRPEAVENAALRLGMVLLLGAVGFAAGILLLNSVLRRVRRTGEVSFA